MNIREKLSAIQVELKAPKNQYNSFGKYSYRSCEDILEAVKPLCAKYKAVLTITDRVEYIGNRFYIKAIATLHDTESIEEAIENVAFAREEEMKKGMDGSQVTGTASSYARKYALNGLFCIDDTKDADTDEHANQVGKTPNIDGEIIKLEKQCIELGLDLGSEQFVSYVEKQVGKVDKKTMTNDEKKKYLGILSVWYEKQKK